MMTLPRSLLLVTALLLAATAQAEVMRGSSTSSHRRLAEFPLLEGYEPTTLVTDHAAIDLDCQEMEDQMALGNFSYAENVYKLGGHSKSYAILNLEDLPNNAEIVAGTRVIGEAYNGDWVEGTVIETEEWDQADFVERIPVLYKTYPSLENYVGCRVGGLYKFHEANRKGCFNDTGVVSLIWPRLQNLELSDEELLNHPDTVTVPYAYHPRKANKNARTLQGMSTRAFDRMRPCDTCDYYPDYQIILDYYGDFDYGDKWIQAAFDAGPTNFKNNRGNADFSEWRPANTRIGRQEAIEKGVEYMNVLMYTIREIEDAISDCESVVAGTGNDRGLHALDEAVAFYVGSMQVTDGVGHFGYHLANRRASEFSTNGETSNEPHGDAYVNIQVMNEFARMQQFLDNGQCEFVRAAKESIVNYMKVPLIQSLLRYANKRTKQMHSTPSNVARYEGEGAAFAASMLPWLYKCSQSDAKFIYEQMKVGSDHEDVDFPKIKETLERNYGCLGTTCVEVGGLWVAGAYVEGAEPCGYVHASTSSASSSGDGLSPGGAFGVTIAVVVAVAALAFFAMRRRRRGPRPSETSRITGNIAAVSEIS